MDLVHLYCFATAPRDIQNANMALDNLTSRQTGLEKSIANDLEKLSARMNVLADIQNEHSNHLMVLGPDFPKDRHAPQHPEPPPGVEPQQDTIA